MKNILVLGLIGIMTSSLCAADSGPKAKLAAAAKQLGDKGNYSWSTTTKEADGSAGRIGPIDGKMEASKLMFLSLTPGGIPVEKPEKAGDAPAGAAGKAGVQGRDTTRTRGRADSRGPANRRGRHRASQEEASASQDHRVTPSQGGGCPEPPPPDNIKSREEHRE